MRSDAMTHLGQDGTSQCLHAFAVWLFGVFPGHMRYAICGLLVCMINM